MYTGKQEIRMHAHCMHKHTRTDISEQKEQQQQKKNLTMYDALW